MDIITKNTRRFVDAIIPVIQEEAAKLSRAVARDVLGELAEHIHTLRRVEYAEQPIESFPDEQPETDLNSGTGAERSD